MAEELKSISQLPEAAEAEAAEVEVEVRLAFFSLQKGHDF
jgi:hypothetical protein